MRGTFLLLNAACDPVHELLEADVELRHQGAWRSLCPSREAFADTVGMYLDCCLSWLPRSLEIELGLGHGFPTLRFHNNSPAFEITFFMPLVPDS